MRAGRRMYIGVGARGKLRQKEEGKDRGLRQEVMRQWWWAVGRQGGKGEVPGDRTCCEPHEWVPVSSLVTPEPHLPLHPDSPAGNGTAWCQQWGYCTNQLNSQKREGGEIVWRLPGCCSQTALESSEISTGWIDPGWSCPYLKLYPKHPEP